MDAFQLVSGEAAARQSGEKFTACDRIAARLAVPPTLTLRTAADAVKFGSGPGTPVRGKRTEGGRGWSRPGNPAGG